MPAEGTPARPSAVQGTTVAGFQCGAVVLIQGENAAAASTMEGGPEPKRQEDAAAQSGQGTGAHTAALPLLAPCSDQGGGVCALPLPVLGGGVPLPLWFWSSLHGGGGGGVFALGEDDGPAVGPCDGGALNGGAHGGAFRGQPFAGGGPFGSNTGSGAALFLAACFFRFGRAQRGGSLSGYSRG